jgi:hypothetical protein
VAETAFTMAESGSGDEFLCDQITVTIGGSPADVFVPATKIRLGSAGVDEGYVGSDNPMPVEDAGECLSDLTEPADWSLNKKLIKASAGHVLGFAIDNSGNTRKVYVQVFDAASEAAVTLGTTKPKDSILVPPGGYVRANLPERLAMSSGIVLGQTTEPAGGTGPDAGVTVITFYQ